MTDPQRQMIGGELAKGLGALHAALELFLVQIRPLLTEKLAPPISGDIAFVLGRVTEAATLIRATSEDLAARRGAQ